MIFAFVAAVAAIDAAFAQGSLGIGRPEPAIRPEGPFAGLLFWIQQHQLAFYRSLTGALKAMRSDGSAVWLLAGLSFGYGIFHAAGPGHGKAVISSYMLANEVAARRGILLSFTAALLQALTAIVVVGGLVLALRGSGIKQSEIAGGLEIASYAAITAIGAWLLHTKLRRRNGHRDRLGHAHAHGEEGCRDAHAHAADPAALSGRLGLRQAAGAVAAVGIRPCSGAVIVLTFAFLNGLAMAGIMAALAMALGTGLTVAALAALAVWAKDLAIAIGGYADRGAQIHRIIEIGGAASVMLLGGLLLAASLY